MCYHADVSIVNCTFVGNISPEGGDIYDYSRDSKIVILNSIIIGGSTFPGGIQALPIVSFSNTYLNGNFPGEGNISEDPLFAAFDDFRLSANSPCIDSGSTTGPAVDLDGKPRPVDVLGVGRDGPGAYDMGCYEFQLPKGDLNGDGKLDGKDLFLFERQWYGEQ